jgi:hypothetical protein
MAIDNRIDKVREILYGSVPATNAQQSYTLAGKAARRNPFLHQRDSQTYSWNQATDAQPELSH